MKRAERYVKQAMQIRWLVTIWLLPLISVSACTQLEDIETHGDTLPVFNVDRQNLSSYSGVQFFEPGSIGACFIGEGLAQQKTWIRDSLYRTWEFFADIKFDWIDQCPDDDTPLVRVSVRLNKTQADEQDGWASGVGTQALKDSRVRWNANSDDNFFEKPSIKFFLCQTAIGRGNVDWLAAHEFGHTLGFQHEQDHPDADASRLALGVFGRSAPESSI